MHLSFGHGTGVRESILNEKLPDLQNSSGVPALVGGSCPVGATQMSPVFFCAMTTVETQMRTAIIAFFTVTNYAQLDVFARRMLLTGHSTSLRLPFAFSGLNE